MSEPDEIMNLYMTLIKKSFIPFPPKGRLDVSNEQGVYIIYDPDRVVLHVGRSVRGKHGINQRLRNHLGNNSSFSQQYVEPNNINLRDGCSFKYLEIEDGRKRALVEALTTGLLCPKHIGTGEKVEISDKLSHSIRS